MKYLRVYEGDYVEEEYLTTYEEHCERVAMIQDNGFDFEGCIVKQADTIEELCDAFVLDHPLFANNCKNLYHSFEKAKNGIKKRSGDAHDLYSFEIYGAIWTDKGLIYVAKTNDKGELELL